MRSDRSRPFRVRYHSNDSTPAHLAAPPATPGYLGVFAPLSAKSTLCSLIMMMFIKRAMHTVLVTPTAKTMRLVRDSEASYEVLR